MAADLELDSGFATRPQQICHKGDGFSMGKPHPRQINLKNSEGGTPDLGKKVLHLLFFR
jgi:hypothetical protein